MPARVLLFEHVNLNISPGRLNDARALFIDALGLLEDPRPASRGRKTTLLWCNAGLCQFHLPQDTTVEEDLSELVMQRIPGELTLTIPPGSMAATAARLTSAGVAFAFITTDTDTDTDTHSHSHCRVSAPCCDIVLRELTETEVTAVRDAMVGCVGHPGATPLSPADLSLSPVNISRITVRVQAAQLPTVAAFWREIIGAEVQVQADNDETTTTTTMVSVRGGFTGCPQELVFLDSSSLSPLPYLGDPSGGADQWHIAFYIDDWEGALSRATAAGVAFDNPRQSDRFIDALANNQFRTLEMGAGGPRLELEIRSRKHPSCPL